MLPSRGRHRGWSKGLASLTTTIVFATFLVIGIGCNMSPDKHEGVAQATFQLKSVVGVPIDLPPSQQKINVDWNIKEAKGYSFTVCVQDRVTRNLVRGHIFDLIDSETMKKMPMDAPKSDVNGCIKWSERLEYDFLRQDSKYVLIKRRIRGTNIHQGDVEVVFAINPWDRDRGGDAKEIYPYFENASLDSQFVLTGEKVNVLLKSGSGQLPLFLADENIRIVTAHEGYDSFFKDRKKPAKPEKYSANDFMALIRVVPKVPLFTLARAPFFHPLSKGKFAVKANLFVTGVGDRKQTVVLTEENLLRALGQQDPNGNGQIFEVDADGQLLIPLNLKLNRFSFKGRLQMAIKVTPVNPPGQMGTFEALYDLGDGRRPVGQTNPVRIVSNQPKISVNGFEASSEDAPLFNYDQYLKKAQPVAVKADAKPGDKESKDGKTIPGNDVFEVRVAYEVGALRAEMRNIRPSKKPSYVNWNLWESKRFVFTVCLRDRFREIEVRGQRFTVRDPETKKLVVTAAQGLTDNRGCIAWTETKFYSSLRKYPRYVLFSREIEGLDEYLGKVMVQVAFNPWELDRGGKEPPVFPYFGNAKLDPKSLLQGGTVDELLMKVDEPLTMFANSEYVETFHGDNAYPVYFDMKQKLPEAEDLGRQFTMLLQLKPRAQFFDYWNRPVWQSFNKGKFKIEAKLVATYGPRNRKTNRPEEIVKVVLSEMDLSKGSPEAIVATDGFLRMPVNINLVRAQRTDINLNLVMRLTPVGAPDSLQPYEALYRIGTYRDILSGRKPTLVANADTRMGTKAFSYDEYLRTTVDAFKQAPQDKEKLVDTSLTNFEITSAEGRLQYVRPKSKVHKEWALPDYKQVRLSACLRHTDYRDEVRGQKFEVMEKGTRRVIALENDGKTTAQGCLTWTETLAYNFLAPKSQYVLLERTIRGFGNYKGQKEIQFAVNPWESERQGNNPSVIAYFNKAKLPSSEVAVGAAAVDKVLRGDSEGAELWMRRFRTVLAERPRDTEYSHVFTSGLCVDSNGHTCTRKGELAQKDEIKGFKYQSLITLMPSVRLFRSDDRVHWHTFEKGKFKVWMTVVAEDVGGRKDKAVLTEMDLDGQGGGRDPVSLIGNGLLNLKLNLSLLNDVRYGMLYVALKVQPHNAPGVMKPFEAKYRLGTMEDLRREKDPVLITTNHEGFSYDAYTNQPKKIEELLLRDKKMTKFSPIYMKTLDIRFETIQAGETATVRTVVFRVKACAVDNITGQSMRNDEFRVDIKRDDRLYPQSRENLVISRNNWEKNHAKNFPDSPKPYMSDEEGCLYWNDQITHRYYIPEQLHRPKVKITHVRSGKEIDLELAINPWDEKWTFGRDARTLSPVYAEQIRKREKPNSLFFLNRFHYDTLMFSYDIDKYLNLTVKKRVLVALEPRVLRYSSITHGRSRTEMLRDGLYLMKIAIQKDYLDPATKGVRIKPINRKPRQRSLLDRAKSYFAGDGYQKNVETQKLTEPAGQRGFTIIQKNGKNMDLRSDTTQFIAVRQKLVRVNNGTIITPVEFELTDLRLLRIRCQLLVQFETIREDLHNFTRTFIEQRGLEGNISEKLEKFQAEIPNIRDEINEKNKMSIQQFKSDRNFQDRLDKTKDIRARRSLRTSYLADLKQKNQKELNGLLEMFTKRINSDASALRDKDGVPYGAHVFPCPEDEGCKDFRDNLRYIDDPRYFRDVIKSRDPELYERMLKIQEKNDFTTISGAPPLGIVANYFEKIKDNQSGLSRRTFVGPITFLLNSNSSHVRPTDNLDEADCDYTADCSEPDMATVKELLRKRNDQYLDNQKYYGMINHFAKFTTVKEGDPEWPYYKDKKDKRRGIHVDDLIKEKIELDRQRRMEDQVNGLLTNFLRRTNMSFVSFRDEPLRSVKEHCLSSAKNNKGFTGDIAKQCFYKDDSYSISAKDMFSFMNAGDPGNKQRPRARSFRGYRDSTTYLNEPPTQASEIIDHIEENRTLRGATAQRICEFWLAQNMGKIDESKDMEQVAEKFRHQLHRLGPSGSALRQMLNTCRSQMIKYSGPRSGISKSKKIRVKDVRTKQFMGGKSMNVNVGSKFDVYYKRDIDVGGGISLGYNLGLFSSKVDHGWGEARGIADGTSVSSQAFLVMQSATFDVVVNSYEYCMELNWTKKFYDQLVFAHSRLHGNRRMNMKDYRQKHLKQAAQGLFICTGKTRSRLLPLREKYFYFTQHFTEGDMLDQGNIYNHPWLLKLRGLRDVETFLSLVEAQPVDVYATDNFKGRIEGRLHNAVLNNVVKHHLWPIEKLNDAYMKATPTFPGMYTVLGGKGFEHELGLQADDQPLGKYDAKESFERLGYKLQLQPPPKPFEAK